MHDVAVLGSEIDLAINVTASQRCGEVIPDRRFIASSDAALQDPAHS